MHTYALMKMELSVNSSEVLWYTDMQFVLSLSSGIYALNVVKQCACYYILLFFTSHNFVFFFYHLISS